MFEKITNKFVPEQRESSKTYRNQIGIFQGWVFIMIHELVKRVGHQLELDALVEEGLHDNHNSSKIGF